MKKDKPFIVYGNQKPISMDLVKTFEFNKQANSIQFFFEAGVISWTFSSVTDAEFVYALLLDHYVTKIDTRVQRLAKDKLSELDEVTDEINDKLTK